MPFRAGAAHRGRWRRAWVPSRTRAASGSGSIMLRLSLAVCKGGSLTRFKPFLRVICAKDGPFGRGTQALDDEGLESFVPAPSLHHTDVSLWSDTRMVIVTGAGGLKCLLQPA